MSEIMGGAVTCPACGHRMWWDGQGEKIACECGNTYRAVLLMAQAVIGDGLSGDPRRIEDVPVRLTSPL